jgi:hypothetical protein
MIVFKNILCILKDVYIRPWHTLKLRKTVNATIKMYSLTQYEDDSEAHGYVCVLLNHVVLLVNKHES